MILSIYRDPKFVESLDELRRQGGVSSAAARKVDEIMGRLLFTGRGCSCEIGKLTKNGEFRIKRCKKYDLGNGYRLVCLRKGYHLVLLYVGTHDDCSRWLERNRDLKYEIDETNGDFLNVRDVVPVDISSKEAKDPADEYEEQLMKQIDDKVLRKVFSGLCEQ